MFKIIRNYPSVSSLSNCYRELTALKPTLVKVCHSRTSKKQKLHSISSKKVNPPQCSIPQKKRTGLDKKLFKPKASIANLNKMIVLISGFSANLLLLTAQEQSTTLSIVWNSTKYGILLRSYLRCKDVRQRRFIGREMCKRWVLRVCLRLPEGKPTRC